MGFDPTDVLTCADCGATTLRRGQKQLYCSECSGRRDTTRKKAWAAAHPRKGRSRPYSETQSEIVEAGAQRSLENRSAIHWDPDEPLEWHTQVRVVVPFDWAASKNAVWRHGRGGHVFAREESKQLRADLAARLQATDVEWFQGKVWIDIYVEKPNHRGDAINVLDLVCDAVKDAIGVDDRWYSISRLDWSIVKENPRLIVGVRQGVIEDHQVCSHCGRALPLVGNFGSNRSTSTGRARVCLDCSAPKRGRKVAA